MKIHESGQPMMAEHEFIYIRDLINNRGFKNCLEWGSGNSTLYFPKECNIKLWNSIEHNGHYVEYINKIGLKENTYVYYMPESEYYYISIKYQINFYDFILVDGLYREECLDVAMQIIKPGGIVLLHDSGRKEYKDFIKKYNHEKIFDGDKIQSDGYFAHQGITIFKK